MSYIILSGDHKLVFLKYHFDLTMMAFAFFFIEFQHGPSIHDLE